MNVLMLVPDTQMIDRRVLQQARTLSDAGYRVTLLAGFECREEAHYERHGVEIHRYAYDGSDERLNHLRKFLPNNERLKRVANRLFISAAWRLFRFSPFDAFILAKCRQFPADVVHVHDLPLLRHGATIAKERGIPLVYDAHEIYYEQECFTPKQKRRLKRDERRYIEQVDIFITVNDNIADYFQTLHKRRPLVLMNSVETPTTGFDVESRNLLRKRAGLPDDARIVLYQGWFSPERNLLALIQAAEYFAENIFLVMIGYGEYEKDLRAALENKSWANKVRFIGRIESEEIMPYTAGANLGIIPYQAIDLNHQLCSPNKFFEFVQAGIPVVAQDLIFFRDMAQKYGVVRVGNLSNAASISYEINSVLGDYPRLEQMREACKCAAKILNWEVEAAKLLKAYEKLAVEKALPFKI